MSESNHLKEIKYTYSICRWINYPISNGKLNWCMVSVQSLILIWGASTAVWNCYLKLSEQTTPVKNFVTISSVLLWTLFIGSFVSILFLGENVEKCCRRIVQIEESLEETLKSSRTSQVDSTYCVVITLKYIAFTAYLLINSDVPVIRVANESSLNFRLHSAARFIVPIVIIDTTIRRSTVILRRVHQLFNLLTGKLKESLGPNFTEDNLRSIEFLVRSYDSLIDCCSFVETGLGVSLLLVTTAVFFELTLRLYVLVKIIEKFLKKTLITTDEYWVPCVTVLNFAIWVWELCELSYYPQKTFMQAKEFTNTLYFITMRDRTLNYAKNNKITSHLIHNQKAEISACGFFTYNYNMILTMMAAACTYVTILFQLRFD